ncbi:MAG: oxygen-independent coproporphyrinogen III oxidase, partial [Burkholderiales bacterium]
ALYLHLPFCESICYYCACNKIVTKHHEWAGRYVPYLGKEIRLLSAELEGTRKVTQMHWGGGTPNFFPTGQMKEIKAFIAENFELDPAGEYSIEVDPRTLPPEKVGELSELGFNRLSIGVQDFDPAVQKAVNRIQSPEQTQAVMRSARASAMRSINLDLIYGLPKQNTQSFARTLRTLAELSPDRVALYNYAHLPALFKPQRRIAEADLPSARERIELLSMAISELTKAGYLYIGMDHFAKPEDELAIAMKQGRLHRNFQGYSTQPDCDLLSFGVSAISKVGPTYGQNTKELEDYYQRLDRDEIPIVRGLELNSDDLLRRALIQDLMCNFAVNIPALEEMHLIGFRRYFSREMEALAELEDAGLVQTQEDWLRVTPMGRFFVRNICMVFDRYLREARERTQYSKAI